ncbi:MAG: glutathione S-transferase N-terminal domain-containing protein [Betaproteobacteria bacterium]|jgi:GSH-dependent disulfide-bond oxidoreductase|nr:glutathione S-transferase N-terminal domain-containing protein [Betaproteobacteria bacterium]
MITLYTWPTPNGKKVQIMLEETGLKYKALPINISANAQFAPDFLKISPNNKIPAIVDSKGPKGKPYSLFESGAILIYLAGKTNTLLGTTETDRYDILQWLMFQMGGLGPMLGQAHHFRIYAPQKIDYAIQRYTQEAQRLYGVMDRRLAQCEYLGCDEYSIADIAAWPWIASYERQGVDIAAYPNVRRWFESIGSRPAVIRGCAVLADLRK